MAMSVTRLAASIKQNRLASNPGGQIVDNAALTADCQAIASAVISELTSYATLVVAAGISVTTAGSASAQTGATTAPGTGSIT